MSINAMLATPVVVAPNRYNRTELKRSECEFASDLFDYSLFDDGKRANKVLLMLKWQPLIYLM